MQLIAKLRRVQMAWWPPMRRWLPIARGPLRTGKIPSLPPFPETTPRQKANLFQEMTADDLFDQMSTPDIRSRLIQILDHLGDNELLDPEYRSSLRDKIWDERTAAHLVLTWYAWRFRPKTFLATGPIDKMALAVVALTSPTTPIVCLSELGNRRRLGQISKAVTRNGYQRRIRLARGGLSQLLLTANPAFDLTFLNDLRKFGEAWPLTESIFHHCSLGGLIVCKAPYGLREREDFRVLEGPKGSGMALAFRLKPGGGREHL
jgi:hypothetical protein